ncbi:hypothetical protein [Methylobacterium oryzae]|nr:hypothetical protein [Methylobacterium oryzae]
MDIPMLAATEGQARQFAGEFGLPPEILARCSTLLCLELMSYHYVHDIDPSNITDEILAMEGIDSRPRGTHRAEKFRHDALRGLWKKHWFDPRFIAQNVLNVLRNGGLDQTIHDVLDPTQAPPGETHQDHAVRLSTLLGRLSVEVPIQQRQSARKLSGEWIVFAPHQTGKHYLSVSTHGEGDAVIREKIIRHCVPEFPFLRDVLRVETAG